MMTPSPSLGKVKYKGHPLFIYAQDSKYYFAQVEGHLLPDGLLVDQHKTGLAEFRGKIPIGTTDLTDENGNRIP